MAGINLFMLEYIHNIKGLIPLSALEALLVRQNLRVFFMSIFRQYQYFPLFSRHFLISFENYLITYHLLVSVYNPFYQSKFPL